MTKDDHLYFSRDYKKKLEENGQYTRDIPSLNRYDNHYLFVYGTLKRGYLRHATLSGSKSIFCGVGVTVDETFDMLIADPANFPVIIEYTSQERQLKVKGELWLVDTETLIKIDHMEANGTAYEREQRRVYVGKECIPAWIYIGISKFWREQELQDSPRFLMNNASAVPVSERTNKHYHHFFNPGISQRLMTKTSMKDAVHVG